MDFRTEWNWRHWTIRLVLMAVSLTAFISAATLVLAGKIQYAPLLVGTSMVVHAISYVPGLLLRPSPSMSIETRVLVIPKTAAFELALGTFWLAVGTVVAVAFPLFVAT